MIRPASHHYRQDVGSPVLLVGVLIFKNTASNFGRRIINIEEILRLYPRQINNTWPINQERDKSVAEKSFA